MAQSASPTMIVALLKDQIKKATDNGKYDLISQLAERIKTIEQVGSLKTQIKAATDEGQYDMIPGLARQTQELERSLLDSCAELQRTLEGAGIAQAEGTPAPPPGSSLQGSDRLAGTTQVHGATVDTQLHAAAEARSRRAEAVEGGVPGLPASETEEGGRAQQQPGEGGTSAEAAAQMNPKPNQEEAAEPEAAPPPELEHQQAVPEPDGSAPPKLVSVFDHLHKESEPAASPGEAVAKPGPQATLEPEAVSEPEALTEPEALAEPRKHSAEESSSAAIDDRNLERLRRLRRKRHNNRNKTEAASEQTSAEPEALAEPEVASEPEAVAEAELKPQSILDTEPEMVRIRAMYPTRRMQPLQPRTDRVIKLPLCPYGYISVYRTVDYPEPGTAQKQEQQFVDLLQSTGFSTAQVASVLHMETQLLKDVKCRPEAATTYAAYLIDRGVETWDAFQQLPLDALPYVGFKPAHCELVRKFRCGTCYEPPEKMDRYKRQLLGFSLDKLKSLAERAGYSHTMIDTATIDGNPKAALTKMIMERQGLDVNATSRWRNIYNTLREGATGAKLPAEACSSGAPANSPAAEAQVPEPEAPAVAASSQEAERARWREIMGPSPEPKKETAPSGSNGRSDKGNGSSGMRMGFLGPPPALTVRNWLQKRVTVKPGVVWPGMSKDFEGPLKDWMNEDVKVFAKAMTGKKLAEVLSKTPSPGGRKLLWRLHTEFGVVLTGHQSRQVAILEGEIRMYESMWLDRRRANADIWARAADCVTTGPEASKSSSSPDNIASTIDKAPAAAHGISVPTKEIVMALLGPDGADKPEALECFCELSAMNKTSKTGVIGGTSGDPESQGGMANAVDHKELLALVDGRRAAKNGDIAGAGSSKLAFAPQQQLKEWAATVKDRGLLLQKMSDAFRAKRWRSCYVVLERLFQMKYIDRARHALARRFAATIDLRRGRAADAVAHLEAALRPALKEVGAIKDGVPIAVPRAQRLTNEDLEVRFELAMARIAAGQYTDAVVPLDQLIVDLSTMTSLKQLTELKQRKPTASRPHWAVDLKCKSGFPPQAMQNTLCLVVLLNQSVHGMTDSTSAGILEVIFNGTNPTYEVTRSSNLQALALYGNVLSRLGSSADEDAVLTFLKAMIQIQERDTNADIDIEGELLFRTVGPDLPAFAAAAALKEKSPSLVDIYKRASRYRLGAGASDGKVFDHPLDPGGAIHAAFVRTLGKAGGVRKMLCHIDRSVESARGVAYFADVARELARLDVCRELLGSVIETAHSTSAWHLRRGEPLAARRACLLAWECRLKFVEALTYSGEQATRAEAVSVVFAWIEELVLAAVLPAEHDPLCVWTSTGSRFKQDDSPHPSQLQSDDQESRWNEAPLEVLPMWVLRQRANKMGVLEDEDAQDDTSGQLDEVEQERRRLIQGIQTHLEKMSISASTAAAAAGAGHMPGAAAYNPYTTDDDVCPCCAPADSSLSRGYIGSTDLRQLLDVLRSRRAGRSKAHLASTAEPTAAETHEQRAEAAAVALRSERTSLLQCKVKELRARAMALGASEQRIATLIESDTVHPKHALVALILSLEGKVSSMSAALRESQVKRALPWMTALQPKHAKAWSAALRPWDEDVVEHPCAWIRGPPANHRLGEPLPASDSLREPDTPGAMAWQQACKNASDWAPTRRHTFGETERASRLEELEKLCSVPRENLPLDYAALDLLACLLMVVKIAFMEGDLPLVRALMPYIEPEVGAKHGLLQFSLELDRKRQDEAPHQKGYRCERFETHKKEAWVFQTVRMLVDIKDCVQGLEVPAWPPGECQISHVKTGIPELCAWQEGASLGLDHSIAKRIHKPLGSWQMGLEPGRPIFCIGCSPQVLSLAWQCVEYPVGIRRLLVPVLVDGFKLAHLKPRAGVRLDLSGPLAAPYYLQHQRRLRTCLGLEPMWANTELGDHLHGMNGVRGQRPPGNVLDHTNHPVQFATSVAMEKSLAALPDGATVILMLGSQDAEDTLTEPQILKHNESCGSYGAVELLPCQGAVVETTAALTIFMGMTSAIHQKKGFEVIIHPVLPMASVNPGDKSLWGGAHNGGQCLNQVLAKALESAPSRERWGARYLVQLQKSFETLRWDHCFRLDGRNFHPYYVALLEAALNFRANAKEARSGEKLSGKDRQPGVGMNEFQAVAAQMKDEWLTALRSTDEVDVLWRQSQGMPTTPIHSHEELDETGWPNYGADG